MYDYATHTGLKQRLKGPISLYPCESRARCAQSLCTDVLVSGDGRHYHQK